ncbi:MAG: PAS domain-containing sensor histidine kinase [Promethearchaeota archaeon]|nr:MAG: PAS domain-containing sensor histidine kinase [Candidatus Lokiarchaeota archaeon]
MNKTEQHTTVFGSSSPTAIFNSEGELVHANNSFLKIWNINNKSEKKKFNLFHNFFLSNDIIKKLRQGENVKYKLKISANQKTLPELQNFRENYIQYSDISISPFKLDPTKKQSYLIQMEGNTQEKELNDISLTFFNLFKILWSNSNEGVFIINDKYKVLYVNKKSSEILDLKVINILGEDIRTFFNNSNFEALIKNAEKVSSGNLEKYSDFSIKTKEGNIKIVKITYLETHETRLGKKIYIQIVDITEKKRTQRELAESEQKFEMLGKQDLISIIILQDNEIKYANKHFLKGVGYTREEIESWSLLDIMNIVHPADRELVVTQARKKQRGDKDVKNNYAFRVIHKDGHIVWRQVYSNTINFQGRPAVLATFMDITDWKKTEKQLKESEEKFRKIVDSIPDLFFLVAKDTTVLDYQATGERLYMPPEEFMNKRMANLLPPPLGEKAQKAVYRTLNTHKSQILEYSLPIKEHIRYFEARLFYYSEEEAAIFIRDISERKRAEQMIKEEIKRLKEIDQMRKDLISRVSHELKTPLMAISGAVEYILEIYEETINKESLELLDMIDLNKDRLQTLIDTLLDVSKIKNKKLNLNKTHCNISEIIKKVCREMEPIRKEREIEIGLNIHENIQLKVDKVRISEVIMNLLSNAIKNTPPEGYITIKTRKSRFKVEIIISDTGIGLTEKEKSKIFTEFGKIERYGEGLEYLDISGSGLGLYISNKIIDLHNGHIQVESKGRNKGSTFKIILPRERKKEKIE